MTRILFIDHLDSFSNNLISFFRGEGVDVTILKHKPQEEGSFVDASFSYDAVVLSPGPYAPKRYPQSIHLLRTLPPKVPCLGVCLGFQLLLYSEGLPCVPSSVEVRHGSARLLNLQMKSQYLSLESELILTKYNSLSIRTNALEGNKNWKVIVSEKEDAIIVENVHKPWIGVQYHPESAASLGGIRLLHAFLDFIRRQKDGFID